MKYIRPPDMIREKGRQVEKRESLQATRGQLGPDEELAALSKRGRGKVAFVVRNRDDFELVDKDNGTLIGLFAVGPDILEFES